MLPAIKKQITQLMQDALKVVAAAHDVVSHDLPVPHLERPKVAEHGDLSTNIAMQLAKRNRIGGGASTFFLVLILGSVVTLYYGSASFHDEARWVHIALGFFLIVLFPWHILRGRKAMAVISKIKDV